MFHASCESTIALISLVISGPLEGRITYLGQNVLLGRDIQEDVFKLDITFKGPP